MLQRHHPIHQLDLHLLKAVHYLLLVTNKCHSQTSQIPVGESRRWFHGPLRHTSPRTPRAARAAAASAYLLSLAAPRAKFSWQVLFSPFVKFFFFFFYGWQHLREVMWFEWNHLSSQGERPDSKASASSLAKDSARHEKSYFQEKSHVRKPMLLLPLLMGEAGIGSWIWAVRSEVNLRFLPLQMRESQRNTNGKSLQNGHHPDDSLKPTRISKADPLWVFRNLPINPHLFLLWGGEF